MIPGVPGESQVYLNGEFLRVGKEAFTQCPSDSIDYAVMERIAAGKGALPSGVVIPLLAGWSDVGAWDALWKVLPKDGHGFSQAPLIFFLAVCLSPFTPHLLHQGLTAGW